jgi:hypothetical protein
MRVAKQAAEMPQGLKKKTVHGKAKCMKIQQHRHQEQSQQLQGGRH